MAVKRLCEIGRNDDTIELGEEVAAVVREIAEIKDVRGAELFRDFDRLKRRPTAAVSQVNVRLARLTFVEQRFKKEFAGRSRQSAARQNSRCGVVREKDGRFDSVVEEANEAKIDALPGENGAFAFDGRRDVTPLQRRVKRVFVGGCVVEKGTAKNANPPTATREFAKNLARQNRRFARLVKVVAKGRKKRRGSTLNIGI